RAFEERPVRALDLVAARQVQAEVRHVVGVFGEQPRVRGGVAVVPGLGETGEDIQDGVVGHDRTPLLRTLFVDEHHSYARTAFASSTLFEDPRGGSRDRPAAALAPHRAQARPETGAVAGLDRPDGAEDPR